MSLSLTAPLNSSSRGLQSTASLCWGYPFARFIAFDVAGESTWILVFGGLGYAFGSQWEVIGDLASDFNGLLVGIVFLFAGVYLLVGRRVPTQIERREWACKGQNERRVEESKRGVVE